MNRKRSFKKTNGKITHTIFSLFLAVALLLGYMPTHMMGVSAEVTLSGGETSITSGTEICTCPGCSTEHEDWEELTNDDLIYEALGDFILSEGNYYLGEDILTEGIITISGTVNLCLNGHNIEYDGFGSSVIGIIEGGTLNLYDNEDSDSVQYGYHSQDSYSSSYYIVETVDDVPNGKDYDIITGGLITGGNGGISDYGGGVILFNSSYTEDTTDAPVFNMYGGTIAGNYAKKSGGGVFIYGEGTFTMYDGDIISNNARYNGGGVFVSTAGTFTMYDGSVSGNEVYYDTGDSTDDDESYESCSGGGVYVGGVFTMNGGTISHNESGDSKAYNGYGGGVYTGTKSTFTMNSGLITENSSTNYGAGVYATGETDNDDDDGFYMNGGTISYNTADDGGSGVYLKGDMFMTNGEISYNDAAGEGGGVYVNDEDASLTMSDGIITYNTAGDGGGGVYIDKGGEFTMSDGTISHNTATNTESGNYNSSSDHDSNVANDGNGGGVYISSGSFNLSGGDIEHNSATSEVDGDEENGNGGGVYVNFDTATFNMTNGTISNNTAEYKGGGVYVYDEFIMGNGTISDNKAVNGGGVYINGDEDNDAIFTMTGGSIESNTSTNTNESDTILSGGGGAVYIAKYSTFNLENGTIKGNDAVDGAGIYVGGDNTASGTLNLIGGSVTSNTATSNGGGVYLSANGTVNVANTDNVLTITDNTADSKSNNLRIPSGSTIDVDSVYSGSLIGIIADEDDFTTAGTKATNLFKSDDLYYTVVETVSSSSYTYSLEEAPTITSVSITEIEDTIYGNDILLTATVSSVDGEIPTGTVTFYNNGTELSTVVVASDGSATYTMESPFAANYSITASFTSTDDNYGDSQTDLPTVFDITVAEEIEIIEGSNQKVEQGQAATFKSNADISAYKYTKVNGEIVDSKYVTVVSGSTVVTLSKEFIDTLDAGTHTIEIVSETGTAETEFTIQAISEDTTTEDTTPEDTTPDTGDYSNIMLWVVMMGFAITSSSYFVVNKKKLMK